MFLFLYILFLSFCVNTVTFGRYKNGVSGFGLISLARWNVSIDTSNNEGDTLELIAGNDVPAYNLSVISNSDVSLRYDIVITGVPSGVEVVFDGLTNYISDEGLITISDAGAFLASDLVHEHNHTLEFSAPLSSAVINSCDINIQVIFNQVI